ncbi:RNA-directed DNA polymerase from mobile element jockey [Trichonephila clavipes]|nr:RNA-directed DNA polymerase from mobile element jockey [Trichonephila clavipes]
MASSTECPLFPKPRKGTTGPTQPEVRVVLRSSLKDRFPTFMFPPPLTGVETILVALTPDQEPFLVASIYAPPNPNYRNLGADLDGIFKIFKSAFLAGDFNAKHTSWGCNYSDPRGNYILRYITNSNLDLFAPPTPTRYGADSASTLDYALIKNLIWPCTADSIRNSVLTIILSDFTFQELPILLSPSPIKYYLEYLH